MPTATDIATFRARFPQFDSVDDAVVTLCLDDAELDAAESVFGDLWGLAVSWLAAHYLATRYDLAGGASGSAPLQRQTARTVDKASVTFADTGEGGFDSMLASTRYGQEFLRLGRRFTGGPIVAC
jgi:hypothetical protein